MSNETEAAGLNGLRVFVVEDEFNILLLLEDTLTSFGCVVVYIASTLAEALEHSEICDVDIAVLDINLAGEKVYPAAETLRRRKIPFVFSTGYGRSGVEPEWSGFPVVQKPFLRHQLEAGLKEALGRAKYH